jgi:hypothetical protein
MCKRLVLGVLLAALVGYGSDREGRRGRCDAAEREKGKAKPTEAQLRAVQVQLRTLTQAAEAFYVANGVWPASLAELTRRQASGGKAFLARKALLDPWGKQYQYDVKGPRHDGMKPDIWTVTPDGKKIGNWPKGK